VNEDETQTDGEDFGTETGAEQETILDAAGDEYEDEYGGDEYEGEEEPAAPQQGARQPFVPQYSDNSPSLAYLQENLDPDMLAAIDAHMNERVNYALQTFAMASGRVANVSQQEQWFSSQYGEEMSDVVASMNATERGDPDAIDKAALAAVYMRAKRNNRTVFEEFRAMNATAPRQVAQTKPRPALRPEQRTPAGQGSRPSAGTASRRGESHSAGFLKSLGLSPREVDDWKGRI